LTIINGTGNVQYIVVKGLDRSYVGDGTVTCTGKTGLLLDGRVDCSGELYNDERVRFTANKLRVESGYCYLSFSGEKYLVPEQDKLLYLTPVANVLRGVINGPDFTDQSEHIPNWRNSVRNVFWGAIDTFGADHYYLTEPGTPNMSIPDRGERQREYSERVARYDYLSNLRESFLETLGFLRDFRFVDAGSLILLDDVMVPQHLYMPNRFDVGGRVSGHFCQVPPERFIHAYVDGQKTPSYFGELKFSSENCTGHVTSSDFNPQVVHISDIGGCFTRLSGMLEYTRNEGRGRLSQGELVVHVGQRKDSVQIQGGNVHIEHVRVNAGFFEGDFGGARFFRNIDCIEDFDVEIEVNYQGELVTQDLIAKRNLPLPDENI